MLPSIHVMSDSPDFLRQAGRILNSGQSRALLLTGNVYDLFPVDHGYAPLLPFLCEHWQLPEFLVVTYELNGAIRFQSAADAGQVRDAWLRWKVGLDANEIDIRRMVEGDETDTKLTAARSAFDDSLRKTVNQPTLALEFLRQLCQAARTEFTDGRNLSRKLLVLIESADLLVPETEISRMSDADRQRIAICHDWFSDPGFLNGDDSVVLIAESVSLLHHRIARLPQVVEIEVPAPDADERAAFVRWFKSTNGEVEHFGADEEFAAATAGLSMHALMQLLKAGRHARRAIGEREVMSKVEDYIRAQLGSETVQFKKPTHTLDDVVGYTGLKRFLREELIPRFRMDGPEVLPGAAVCGPIGSGKSFIFEAVSAEVGMVVLTLGNLRSKWFGETDIIFERLRRVLNTLPKVLIFVDEADTQFGGVGEGAHETERRLTGKIQVMMADPALRGRVFWLLATARIERLSPDLRRPGRVGDLIIPVLDPEGDDRRDFIRWMLGDSSDVDGNSVAELETATKDYSAAAFAAVRSELRAVAKLRACALTDAEVRAVVADQLPPDIGDVRRYQTLQALVNCTRRQLLPDPAVTDAERAEWRAELRRIEAGPVTR